MRKQEAPVILLLGTRALDELSRTPGHTMCVQIDGWLEAWTAEAKVEKPPLKHFTHPAAEQYAAPSPEKSPDAYTGNSVGGKLPTGIPAFFSFFQACLAKLLHLAVSKKPAATSRSEEQCRGK